MNIIRHVVEEQGNNIMSQIPNILEMFKAGLHFGHRVSKRHPKMEPYIYTQKNTVHIINLEVTQKKLKEALEFIEKAVAKGGTVLFLATKKQAQEIVKKAAIDCGSPYIVERYVGGTFTNFSEISKLIKKLKSLVEKKKTGELSKYTKKEQLEFDKEIERLNKLVGGIQELTKLPDVIFVLDVKKERGAVIEARKKEIPIVAVCDTNVDPTKIDYPIPANDDAVKSITMISGLVSEAINNGKKKIKE